MRRRSSRSSTGIQARRSNEGHRYRAVILTGEALRRENAQAISAMLSEAGGEFSRCHRGHHMESMLAAYGSAPRSDRPRRHRILNLDIGGGSDQARDRRRRRVLATRRVIRRPSLSSVDADAASSVSILPVAPMRSARSGLDARRTSSTTPCSIAWPRLWPIR